MDCSTSRRVAADVEAARARTPLVALLAREAGFFVADFLAGGIAFSLLKLNECGKALRTERSHVTT